MDSTENILYQKENEEHQTMQIQYSLRPAYYDTFQCKAQDCRFNCCTGWNIAVNQKDYLRLQKQQGSEIFQQKLKQIFALMDPIQEHTQATQMPCHDNGECLLLTKEGLCALQLECGYEALPEVCKLFPRNIMYSYSGYKELSLSFACEAVLEQLWNLPEGIDFILEELPPAEYKIGTYKKNIYSAHFQEIRSFCIDILQDRRFSLEQRILFMGMFLQKMPTNKQEVENWYTETQMMMENSNFVDIWHNTLTTSDKMLGDCICKNMLLLQSLSTKIENKKLNECQRHLFEKFWCSLEDLKQGKEQIDIACYQECKEKFEEYFGDKEYFFENIMVSFCYSSQFPDLSSKEDAWKNYVTFCMIYSLIHFISMISCIELVPNQKEQLFAAILSVTRDVVHNSSAKEVFTNFLFKQEQTSLAHIALLLMG